jgi:hypothetical protein
MTATADAVAKLAAALSVIERNALSLISRGRGRYLGSFPADVAAVTRLTTLGLVDADGQITRAGRAVLAPPRRAS